jgi:hypothetical protein
MPRHIRRVAQAHARPGQPGTRIRLYHPGAASFWLVRAHLHLWSGSLCIRYPFDSGFHDYHGPLARGLCASSSHGAELGGTRRVDLRRGHCSPFA